MPARLRVFARALFQRSKVERELDEELRFHLERAEALFAGRGMSAGEARRAARRQFGNITVATEASRAAHRIQLLDDLMADVRYGTRALRRTPLFTVVAVVTIALGVGANAAIFGVIDAVLLRMLPVRSPEQLVFVSVVGSHGERYGGPPYPWVEEIRARNTSFAGMAVFAVDHVPVVVDGRVEQVMGQVTSGAYFDVVGVRAVLGRVLTPDDERLNPPVAVIGYDYWQRRFSGRRDVVGTVIRYQDRAVTIVGVIPRGFSGLQTGQHVDMTFPVTMVGYGLLRDTGAWWSTTVARLREHVPIRQAQREVNAIFATVDAGSRRSEAARRVELVSASRGLDRLRRQLATPLLLVLGAVAAVLLIACANIANLLSVRAASRRRELAVRSALGAGSGRLVRQLLTESVLLFTIGGVVGLLVAKAVHRVLEGYLAVGRMPITLDLTLNSRVLGVAAALTLVAGLLSGLAPAWRAGSRQGNGFMDLPLGGRTANGSSPTSRSLVVVQLAVSVVVLLGGSLLLRTLVNLRSVDLGFRVDGMLTLSVHPLETAYTVEQRRQVLDRVLERVRRRSDVQSASLSVLTPLSGRDRSRGVVIPGHVPRSGVDNGMHVNYVSPGYFETFGIPITVGRSITSADDAGAPTVAVMNSAAARLYFDSRPALGTQLGFEPADDPPRSYTLVGVSGDSRHLSVRDPAPRFVYLPLGQVPDLPTRVTLAVRTRGALPAMGDIVRREIEQVGADILVSDVETVAQQVDRALLRERLTSTLSVAFAALGLLLAALGLYGVAAYAVLARTPEIGIRMALGSTPGAVQWLMLRQALAMGTVGVVIGLPLSVAVAVGIRHLLYDVAPTDPIIVATCVAILFAVTALAGYLPARRASRIDPVRALAAQ